MTQTSMRSLASLAIWGVVIAVFCGLFFGGDGPGGFGASRMRIALSAVVFGGGYLAFFAAYYVTRTRQVAPGVPVQRDERDDRIVRQASVWAFALSLAYVYLLALGLWEVHREPGVVPVGWLFFVAYTAVFVGMMTQAAAALALDRWMGTHGVD